MNGLATRPTDILEETYVDAQGYLVRAADDEVLGRPDVAVAFSVDSEDAADWTLRLRSEIEGDRAGLLARKAAVVAMLDAELARIDGRLKWWVRRFGDQLIEFARNSLKGKDRTWRSTWGTVAFRRTAGTHRITDMEAAVHFVGAYAPHLVRVEKSVTVTDTVKTLELAYAPGDEPAWLESTGPGEKATIATGVGQ